MKKPSIRVLSFLMALLLTLQVSPMAFASDLQDVTTETVEEAPEEVIVEVVEEDSEEIPEEHEEETTEETVPEETEEAVPEETEESEKLVSVSFVFEAEYALTLTQDEEKIAPQTADETTVTYLLAPGSYFYTAKMRGHIGTAEGTVEVTEDMEAVSIAPELEKYPYGIPGLALGIGKEVIDADFKAFMTENRVSEKVHELINGRDYVSDRLVISAENDEQAQIIADAYGADLLSFEYGMGILKLNGISVAEAVEASMDEELMLPPVEPDYIVTLNDPAPTLDLDEVNAAYSTVYGSNSWRSWMDIMGSKADTYLKNPSASNYPYHLDRMNMYKAWGIVTGDSSVRLAIIDTGLASHTEFTRVGTKGYDSAYYSSGNDDNGHGTHCAGIAAAAMGNSAGVAGIAPGVTVYSYKALGANGGGASSSVVKGINWAVDSAKADVISMSLNSPFMNYSEETAIRRAISFGITVVVSMGNEGSNMRSYPAGYSIPGMIVVGATDASNAKAPYSNYGSWCDIMAPGTNIISTGTSGNYVPMSGTSMATPAVAGACALFMSKFGHRTVAPKDMEKMVKASKTNGVLDVYKLVSKSYTPKYLGYSLAAGTEDVTEKYDASERLPQNLSILLNSEDTVIYTLDGTLPGCLNGQVANGEVYKNAIRLSDFEVGDRIQLNAVAISEDGDMGEILTLNFMVVAAEIEENEEAEVPAETTEPEVTEDGEMAENVGPMSRKIYVGYKSGAYQYTYKSAYNYYAGLYPLVSATVYSTLSPNYTTQNYVTVEVKNDYGNAVSFVLSTTSKIVTVSGNKVTAVPGKTGTATIKATALDGSKKTVTFKVKVVNPASRIDISTKAPSMDGDYYLAIGKSTTHKATLGDAYGKPSSKKVEWHARLYRTNGSSTTYWDPGYYFKISTSGKLTINKNLQYASYIGNTNYSFYVDVWATTTDGTNLTSNTIRYGIQAPVTKMTFNTDRGEQTSAKMTMYANSGHWVTVPFHIYTPAGYYHYVNCFQVTSSNPKVASARFGVDNNGKIVYDSITVYANAKGTATITIKANDGSGKTAKLKVTVR